MNVFCTGVSCQSTSFETLNCAGLNPEEGAQLMNAVQQEGLAREALVLSTCNRVEIYIAGLAAEPEEIVHFLQRHLPRADCWDNSYTFTGVSAVRHLYRVACGLDSLIVGEYEILSQLRKAAEYAGDAGSLGPQLERLIQRAGNVGRRARLETKISRGNLSVASEAVSMAELELGGLTDKTALVIGSGEAGELTAKVLAAKATAILVISNRTRDSAVEVAERVGCRAVGLENLTEDILASDLVVCSTDAPRHIVTRSMLESVLVQQSTPRKRVFLDLGLPANVDPDIVALPQVKLLTIKDLQERANQTRQQRREEISKVEAIIEDEMANTRAEVSRRESREFAAHLRREIEAIRQDYLHERRDQVSPGDQDAMEKFTLSLVNRVMHRLTVNLRQIDASTQEGKEALRIARMLFEEPPSSAAAERGQAS